MKKYRKCKTRRIKPKNKRKAHNRNLRSGSKEVKARLIQINPRCDICGVIGNSKSLQLHHIYLIRHGFPTQLEHCTLHCPVCHHEFHKKWDKYLDTQFKENPNSDFMAIYNTLKRLS
jgi:5-methylcytosine-specific restriction endonuclease McrA